MAQKATPLTTKLGIKAGSRAILIGAPKKVGKVLSGAEAKFARSLAGEFAYMHLFVTDRQTLDSRLPKLKSHLSGSGSLWVSWPRGGANGTDLSLKKVIEIGYNHGLVESKTIRVDSTWSGMKFTFPKKGKRYKNSYGKLPVSSRNQLLRFPSAVERDPAIDAWFESRAAKLGPIGRPWFERMRRCGKDVRELLHDGHPTACVGDAAFGYVNAFTAHVNVGFFLGAQLADPAGLLEGTGKRMRHVKLRPGAEVDREALAALVQAAYSLVKSQA